MKMWNPRLLGLLIGDGYYGSTYTSSQLAVSEPEILDYLDSQGIKYSIYNRKSCETPFFRYITLKATQKRIKITWSTGTI